jgi:molybdate transport system ATP-binding protein
VIELDFAIRKTLVSGKRRFTLDVASAVSGQRIVLLGPSGAGKSMTVKAIAGLVEPDAGHVRINGRTLFDAAGRINVATEARQVGYVFQDYALFPHLNVRQNIGFGLQTGWRNPAVRKAAKEVDHWLEVFGLSAMAHQLPAELSGGQRQRTALARALVKQPSALLLDEPFSALDPHLRATLRAELDALQKRLNIPMVLITHDAADAALFGDIVLELDEGRVVTRTARSS